MLRSQILIWNHNTTHPVTYINIWPQLSPNYWLSPTIIRSDFTLECERWVQLREKIVPHLMITTNVSPEKIKQFYTEFQIFSSVTTTTVLVMMIDSYAYHRDHLVRDDQIEFLLSSLSNLYFINQTTKWHVTTSLLRLSHIPMFQCVVLSQSKSKSKVQFQS